MLNQQTIATSKRRQFKGNMNQGFARLNKHSLSIGCPFLNQTILASGLAKALQLKVTDSPSVTLTLYGPSFVVLKFGSTIYTSKFHI